MCGVGYSNGTSHDGGVELLNFLPQPPGLLLHLHPLLLQLGDILHGLLQGDGMAGLWRAGGSEVAVLSWPVTHGKDVLSPHLDTLRQFTCLELLEIKLFRVLKPILILKRLFCSAEMCFCRFYWGINWSMRYRPGLRQSVCSSLQPNTMPSS